MATYFDPRSWSPIPSWSPARAVDLGKRLYDRSWLEQWVTLTTAWVDPVADLSAGTVTALMPDVLMTVLSEGILSRFGGREVTATLLGHDVHATLQVLKVRRRGAHFQTKTVLSRMRWDTHPIETVTVIAHGVRLVPGVPTRLRAARLDIEGTVTVAAVLDWLNRQPIDWHTSVAADGRIVARHRRRKLTALVDASVTDDLLTLDIDRANWLGVRIPRRLITAPDLILERLPHGARLTSAVREGDLVRFRVELPEMTGSFDLTQMRAAIVAGTSLIIF